MKYKYNKELRRTLAKVMDLPREVVLSAPKLTLYENNEMLIENFRSVIEFNDKIVRVKIGEGAYKITGEHLQIHEITLDDLMIRGVIQAIELMR